MNISWTGWPEEPREDGDHRGTFRAALVLIVLGVALVVIVAARPV